MQFIYGLDLSWQSMSNKTTTTKLDKWGAIKLNRICAAEVMTNRMQSPWDRIVFWKLETDGALDLPSGLPLLALSSPWRPDPILLSCCPLCHVPSAQLFAPSYFGTCTSPISSAWPLSSASALTLSLSSHGLFYMPLFCDFPANYMTKVALVFLTDFLFCAMLLIL